MRISDWSSDVCSSDLLMSRVRPLSCAAGAALAFLLAACSSEAPPAPPPPEVNIVTVRTQAVPNVIELPGRVQAYRTSEVRARVNGIVERRRSEEQTSELQTLMRLSNAVFCFKT